MLAAVGCEESVELISATAAGGAGASGVGGRAGAAAEGGGGRAAAGGSREAGRSGGGAQAAGSGGANAAPECARECTNGAFCAAGVCVGLPSPSTLATGSYHTCAVLGGNRAGCWGANDRSQLGLSPQDDEAHRDPNYSPRGQPVSVVAAGARVSCGIVNRAVWCWGDDSVGQTGRPESAATGGRGAASDTAGASGGDAGNGGDWMPRFESVGGWEDVKDVKCGGDNCCAFREPDELHCWGDNTDGGAALADTTLTSAPPTRVKGSFLRSFSVGLGHSCAIDTQHRLLCWGLNKDGQLGSDTGGQSVYEPSPVGEPALHDWLRVAAGDRYTCGIRGPRELWCWGRNTDGMLLGSESSIDSMSILNSTPVKIQAPKQWAEIAAGGDHRCGITIDGKLWCWGSNSDGQLGLEDDRPSADTPQPVAPDLRWKALALGVAHSGGVLRDDTFYLWGKNDRGQIGPPEGSRNQPQPSQVPLPP